jgi:ADP-heptose:LPS heptosyltransferase
MSAQNPWLSARNLLAIRLDNAGDVVMLGPALRSIKAINPDADITLLASPAGSQASALLPWIDDLLVWRSVWQDLGQLPFAPTRERELIGLLESHGFDAAFIFTSFSQTPHVAGYVCYLAGIPLRAGQSKEFGGASLTHEVRGLPDDMHQVDRNLQLLESVEFPTGDRRLEVDISNESHISVSRRLQALRISAAEPLAILHPGASARARRYPAFAYGKVAALLRQRGWQPILTGSARESDLLDAVTDAAEFPAPRLTDLTMPEFAALIARATVVVCGNTLPMHLADAVGTSVVALYSGTDLISQWGPRRTPARLLRRPVPCAPCYRFDCPIGLPCLDISPIEIMDSINELTVPRRASAYTHQVVA